MFLSGNLSLIGIEQKGRKMGLLGVTLVDFLGGGLSDEIHIVNAA